MKEDVFLTTSADERVLVLEKMGIDEGLKRERAARKAELRGF
jgi:hypothetical protein